MLSWMLLIIVLVGLTAVGIWFWGSVFGRGEVLPPLDPAETVAANRQALRTGNIDDVRFELVPRGYRPEQVDDVIAQLTRQLAEARGETPGPEKD